MSKEFTLVSKNVKSVLALSIELTEEIDKISFKHLKIQVIFL